jgi:hypothetical protein
MPETWYAHPNDLIGGWSVLNRDHPPSGLNRVADPDGREVATFMSEADARRIADLRNAQAVTADINYANPDVKLIGWALHASYCCDGYHDGSLSDEDIDGARAVLRVLAGRLLPEGGETRTEWGMRDRTGKVYPARDEADARDLAAHHAARGVKVVRHSIWTGPWVEVTDER